MSIILFSPINYLFMVHVQAQSVHQEFVRSVQRYGASQKLLEVTMTAMRF